VYSVPLEAATLRSQSLSGLCVAFWWRTESTEKTNWRHRRKRACLFYLFELGAEIDTVRSQTNRRFIFLPSFLLLAELEIDVAQQTA